MFIFLLSIGLTDPINNVFAEEVDSKSLIDQLFLLLDQIITDPLFIKVTDNALFLLLVGGIVSSLLVAWVTGRWQARRESFQMKSQLVTKINRSATKLIVALEFNARKESLDKKPIHQVFFEWRETSAEIGATVRVHWHAKVGLSPVVQEWNNYFEVVKHLYNIIVLNINMENVDIEKMTVYEKAEFEKKIAKQKDELKQKNSNLQNYLTRDTKDMELEYKPEDCNTALKNFFKAFQNQDTKDIERCVPDLLFFIDKRKYYLLTLIFKEPIISYDSFFKFKK